MSHSTENVEVPTDDLRVIEEDFGTRYLGSGQALVRAGLVRREQLPGPNGPRRRSAVYYGGEPASRGRTYPHDERYMRVELVGRDLFSVWVWCSKAKREAVEARLTARRIEAASCDEERARAAAWLSRIPASTESYKSDAAETVASFLNAALSIVQASDRHGYSFDEKALQQVLAAASRLRAAIQGGGVVFDARRHERVVADLRERAGLPPEMPRLRLVSSQESGPRGR